MLEILIGLVASGKSTYCKKRAKEGWLILNDDAIVNLVHGGNYLLYQKDLKPLYKSIEDHVFHTAILAGKNLVVDRGLDVSIFSRTRWIALARSCDVRIQAVVFDVFPPEIHARRRFESDSRGHSYEYWLDVAQAHAKRYQKPSMEEGFSEILFVHWK